MLLVAAVAMFGGVYLWAAVALACGVAVLGVWIRPSFAPSAPLATLDRALAALLAGIALQAVPLPAALAAVISPAAIAFHRASTLAGEAPSVLPLTLDRGDTLHAWLAAAVAFATF